MPQLHMKIDGSVHKVRKETIEWCWEVKAGLCEEKPNKQSKVPLNKPIKENEKILIQKQVKN